MFWKIESLGVTADSVMNKGSNDQRAMYGTLWKFADDKETKIQLPPTDKNAGHKAPPGDPPASENGDGENTQLTDGDQSEGGSESDGDTATGDEEPPAMKFTDEQLESMNKDQLVGIASSLGVVNLNQSNKKLIEAIKAKI